MYYTIELMSAEDFVERIENQCRHELAEKLRKQNRSPEEIAQPIEERPKTAEPEKAI